MKSLSLVFALSLCAFAQSAPSQSQSAQSPRPDKIDLRLKTWPSGAQTWQLAPLRRDMSEILSALATAEGETATFDSKIKPLTMDWFDWLDAPTIGDLIAQLANYGNLTVQKTKTGYHFTVKPVVASPPVLKWIPVPAPKEEMPKGETPKRRDDFNFGPTEDQQKIAKPPFWIKPDREFRMPNPLLKPEQ